MDISIIIPTYNEAETIAGTLSNICNANGAGNNIEVIVSDAGDDNTIRIAGKFPVRTCRSPKGRSIQMNRGAQIATGQILYFLHADTVPPPGFADSIVSAVEQGKSAGCFQLCFDDPHWLMQTYGWFTRLPLMVCRGGDQSLFITRDLFSRIGGFNEKMRIMEDIEIIERINRHTVFTILDDAVITSARKYAVNGRIRLQVIFGTIHLLYALGFDLDLLTNFYSRNIS
ncbi:glycosyl hydrolase [Prosthecochloris marina]|uniref:Glycosyl hydrolase n=1 Tax=Prosthecochloris marina TaxID=2017681 RepID=A0A317T736_9CHLB|nr:MULTISPECIES: TIGR04283 family arsenosugar biosynthesis glycosyltransferase [Prosthecochloris]PWW82060.1 glycosyl hydrolase [Prosthecochloris marina]UZJ39679.1 TIGR04283 family arsenosugar biosynthesis glycosyltransferase [Prosthecochloris sp. SCSIO W1102]